MQHTDIIPIVNAVKAIEMKDLIQALRAHRGRYDFPEYPDCPTIEYWDECKGPSSADVKSVSLTGEPDTLRITVTTDDGLTEDIEPRDIYPGHLSTITETLPEPGLT